MKKACIILPAAGLAAAACAVFLTAPGRASKEKKAPFWGRNIAHRGMHTADKRVPENSLAAFEDAVSRGYGIELDVHLSADGEVVVIHDDTVDRVCQSEGRVNQMHSTELKKLRLYDTDQTVPLLSEVLGLVAGRCPIVLEIKHGNRRSQLCARVLEQLREYTGDVCVESFDPLILRWFKKNAPDILRGQLACNPADFGEDTSKIQAFALGNLLTNFISRPQFIAYKIGRKPAMVKLCEALGAMKVAWTATESAAEAVSDMVIFEHYRPTATFK